MSSRSAWQALFIRADDKAGASAEAGDDARLCIYHPPWLTPGDVPHGALVYLHPFGEEMNKSRRMAAQQARAAAEAGFAVLQIDLKGCGDSSGEFAEASWEAWLQDAVTASQWLLARHPAPLWLWGLRAGCLLAAEAAERLPEPCNFLFWQPAAAGRVLLHQFLRLKLAGDLLDGKGAGVTEGLRSQLAAGHPVEVGGYELAPAVAMGLEHARLRPPRRPAHCVWIETSTREAGTLPPASQSAVEAWRAAGHRVDTRVVQGPAFWQTQEIEDAPELIAATTRELQAALHAIEPAGA